jgi:hypothetical protein
MAAIVDRMICIYRKEYDKNPVFTLFLTILVLFFAVFVAAALMSGGNTIHNILNYPGSLVLSDFFDSILHSSDHPYTKYNGIYPPLVTALYALLGRFIIPYVDVPVGEELSSEIIRNSQLGIMSFVFITLITMYALYIACSKIMKDADIRKDLLFLFAILLAYPFIFAIERGNNIILALVFCLIFLIGYRSENKWIRYASYAALGFATGFKLYPAILWLLTLRDRVYKEAGICAMIVAALVFVPFIFTDGNPFILLDNISYHSQKVIGAYGATNITSMVFLIFNGVFSESVLWLISNAVIVTAFIMSIIIILFDKEMKFWKVVALISCNLILGPGTGVQYQMVYMLLPILYFLASEKKMSRENLFYTVCFAMTMVLIPGIQIMNHPSRMIGGMESVFVVMIMAAILYEGLLRIYRNRRSERLSTDAA